MIIPALSFRLYPSAVSLVKSPSGGASSRLRLAHALLLRRSDLPAATAAREALETSPPRAPARCWRELALLVSSAPNSKIHKMLDAEFPELRSDRGDYSTCTHFSRFTRAPLASLHSSTIACILHYFYISLVKKISNFTTQNVPFSVFITIHLICLYIRKIIND